MDKTITAFIGVIGSGKDFQANKLATELKCKIFDFSDGVRNFTFSILDYKPDRECYLRFKVHENTLSLPAPDGTFIKKGVTGRIFLESVGLTLRNYDKDFWAKLCASNAEQYILEGAEHVVFNAVRYVNEAEEVMKLSRKYGFKLQYIFTNYKSERYEIRFDESELYAQQFLVFGCEDLEDITDNVIISIG